MEEIKMSVTLPITAKELYNAWLDSKKHSLFTGGEAKINKKTGSSFSAWEGYISGKNIELKDGQFIKQTWRTSEFDEDAPDSIIEISFEEKNGKTKLNLYHYNLQNGDGKKYKDGWKQYYFEPMKEYFAK